MNASLSHGGIVAYVGPHGRRRQRERIEAALTAAGASAEIIEETPAFEDEGRRGLARAYDLLGRSDVSTLVIDSLDALFPNPTMADRWRRGLAVKHGVRVVEVGGKGDQA